MSFTTARTRDDIKQHKHTGIYDGGKLRVDALTNTDGSPLSAESFPHVLLDGAVHTDVETQTVTRGSLIYANSTPKWDELVIGAANAFLGSDGTDAAWTAAAALTRVDDTNVTLTLGGSPTTALLRAASLTLGWAGQLSLARGGTNKALTAIDGGLVYTDADSMEILAAPTAVGQVLRATSATAFAWGALDLSDTDAITGDLPFANLAQVTGPALLGRSTASLGDVSAQTTTANLLTWLADPTSAKLAAAVSDETGTGALVFGTSPTLLSLSDATTPLPVLIDISNGTGLMALGGGNNSSYAYIGLAGSTATANYNLTSSPGDTHLYINRPSGKEIRFREANSSTTEILMLAGGGMTMEAGDFTNSAGNIRLARTTASTAGIVYKDGDPFCHSLTNAAIYAEEGAETNLFLGAQAGNLSQPSDGDESQSTLNVGIGYKALAAVTYGSNNLAFGGSAALALTEGSNNVAIGSRALISLTTGGDNMGIGSNTLTTVTTGSNNICVGSGAGGSITGSSNTAIGPSALGNATGSNNIGIGYFAGRYVSGNNTAVIDGFDRVTAARELRECFLYGTMSSSAASQTARINATVTIPDTISVVCSGDDVVTVDDEVVMYADA